MRPSDDVARDVEHRLETLQGCYPGISRFQVALERGHADRTHVRLSVAIDDDAVFASSAGESYEESAEQAFEQARRLDEHVRRRTRSTLPPASSSISPSGPSDLLDGSLVRRDDR